MPKVEIQLSTTAHPSHRMEARATRDAGVKLIDGL